MKHHKCKGCGRPTTSRNGGQCAACEARERRERALAAAEGLSLAEWRERHYTADAR